MGGWYLHSNMFLLRPKPNLMSGSTLKSFTFQYVSIKTAGRGIPAPYFLKFTFQYVSIKTDRDLNVWSLLQTFTFQYVSIKTSTCLSSVCMFSWFTFQYVSIKTQSESRNGDSDIPFTFQYVSIKTKELNKLREIFLNLHSNMFLLRQHRCLRRRRIRWIYIPICFY